MRRERGDVEVGSLSRDGNSDVPPAHGPARFLAYFDFNNDGTIDIVDFGQFAIRMFTVLP